MRKKSFVTIIIILLLSLITWILFLHYQTYEKKVNFENELKCQEYADDFEDNLINKTIDLFKYKYGEDLSDKKIIKKYMSPYGMFYSKKHNACMAYLNYNGMLFIEPYIVASRDDAGYYAWYCPGPSDADDCYYFYNKSYAELLGNDIFKDYWNDDYTKLLYFDLNLDSKMWKGKKMDWRTTHDDFWYIISKLGIHQTKSWDGFMAHHYTLFAFLDKSRQDFEEYRLYHEWVDITLIIIGLVIGAFVIYLVSHWIYLLFCKIGIVKIKKYKKKKIN